MDKIAPPPPIANTADYVDALGRLQSTEKPLKWKFIEGRRMRDKFLDKVIVPDNVPEEQPG
jgi:hypothetical protein